MVVVACGERLCSLPLPSTPTLNQVVITTTTTKIQPCLPCALSTLQCALSVRQLLDRFILAYRAALRKAGTIAQSKESPKEVDLSLLSDTEGDNGSGNDSDSSEERGAALMLNLESQYFAGLNRTSILPA